METIIAKFVRNNQTLTILFDDHCSSPRENDNVCNIVCFHKRHHLGDTDTGFKSSDFGSWAEVKANIEEKSAPVLAIKPLYLYDHSGLTISTSPFSCPWDSGQIGFVYITEAKAIEFGIQTDEATLDNIIEAEVKEYDQWLKNDVYGFVLETEGQPDESCWGFFGTDWKENGLVDNAGLSATWSEFKEV